MDDRKHGASPAHRIPSWRMRLPFHYRWMIILSLFLAQAVSYGAFYSFSVFFVALLDEYGWSRAGAAGAFSLHVAVVGLAGLFAGGLLDRFPPNRVLPAGGVVLAVSLIAASSLSELWHLYLLFGILSPFGIALTGAVPGATIVVRWFPNSRGVALAAASAGIGMGVAAVVPFAQHLISTVGWRAAFLVLGLLAFVCITPQTALLQVERPESLDRRSDGATQGRPSGAPGGAKNRGRLSVVDEAWASRSWTVGAAIRTRRLWLLGTSLALSMVAIQMLWVHQVAFLVDAGYDGMVAASVMGLAGLLSMPCKLIWGAVADFFGREIALTLGACATLLAILLLAMAGASPSLWLALLYAVSYAAGYAVNAPVIPAAAGDIFPGRSFGSILGAIFIGNSLGGATGAWLAGYIFDSTGSYLLAFALAAGCTAAGAGAMWLAAPRGVRRVGVPPSA